MTVTFTTPSHLTELARRTAAKGGSLPLEGASSRDPHALPSFDEEFKEPVLYLPPLLSSLPARFESTVIETPEGQAPLTTVTRLPDIDPASLSLHKALHRFRPLHRKYASTPYAESFNWDELKLPEDEEREWYCVAFRSKRKDGSDGTRTCMFNHRTPSMLTVASALYEADRKAHEEAVKNGGVSALRPAVPFPS